MYLELWHDVKIVSYNELYPVSHSIDLCIADGTGHLHWVNVDGYHCMDVQVMCISCDYLGNQSSFPARHVRSTADIIHNTCKSCAYHVTPLLYT